MEKHTDFSANASHGELIDMQSSQAWSRFGFAAIAVALAGAFCWSYWPTLLELAEAWNNQPDYSHGWLIIPVVVYFIWHRWGERPALSRKGAWLGLALLLAALAVRVAGSFWFLSPLAGWSIPLWVAGACWFLCGWNVARWALPAIGFLVFMVPLPFRGETLLSAPLQSIATRLSCFALQCLGEAAIREGNVIVLGEHRIAVAEACSGLRIFMSIVALAFAYVLLTRKPLRLKMLLLLTLLPIALITNASRIVITAWLHVHSTSEAAHRFSHDAAGWLMMPFAAALMAAVLVYSDRLFIEVHSTVPRELLLASGRQRAKKTK